MPKNKLLLDIVQIRALLNIPEDIDITHLGLYEDPYALAVYVQGENLPDLNDAPWDWYDNCERPVMRVDYFDEN